MKAMSAKNIDNKEIVNEQVATEHGLTIQEYQKILQIMGRTPNLTELGIFSVMWSEHCSYKTTRKWLSQLPTKGERVICGPGENAGVIDIDDGQAIIFKMESHNHPSFIEPYQGAATGVGGILRDVFTMGARPIALMNALRFGSPENERTKHLIAGVVSGIGGYGNCVGVPNVGGECNFDAAYNGNILVNAMAVGLAESDKIFYSAAAGLGNPVIYVGSKTGRDGIHGATMASAEFDDASAEKRPTVQVGDPFTEKLLIEACLELMQTDAIVAIQDMGAAGLTCSSLEMAGKGGLGIELELSKVPQRELNMSPYEIMLSESQERMLMVIKPEREELAHQIFKKWELDVATIGTLTDTGRLVLKMHGELVGDMPIAPISTNSPVLDRPYETVKAAEVHIENNAISAAQAGAALRQLLQTPDLCSKRWIYEQYDSQVMNDTVATRGSDAAIVRIHGTDKAIAISTDCTPRYCYADPVMGGKQAVAETWRNITASGAEPIAITNCLNFGSPEKPEIMGQIVGCLHGMAKACEMLDFPIVSGNVSLYNETSGASILPTPAIGGVGLFKDATKHATIGLKQAGNILLLIGDFGTHLGASIYLRDILGKREGLPPMVDLAEEKRSGDAVRNLIKAGLLASCHDLSDGGLLVAVAEAAMQGGRGIELELPTNAISEAGLFGEDQARYLIEVSPTNLTNVMQELANAKVSAQQIGVISQNDELKINSTTIAKISELKAINEAWLPNYMNK
jgi:phosphoribosylformylglycinamidine synthase